jgi:hypothetical protein
MFGHLQLQKKGARTHHFEDPWLYTIDKREQELTQQFLKADARVAVTNRYLVSSGYLSNGSASSIFIHLPHPSHAYRRKSTPFWSCCS